MKGAALALVWVAAAILLPSAGARAQERDPIARLDEALRRPNTVVDTALLFTNLGNAAAKVRMVAFDSSGALAGEKEIEVPGNGLAYVLASELVQNSDPRRFIGKVNARGNGRLAASAVLFGGALTDLPSTVTYGRAPVSNTASQPYTAAMFPVVVTY